jgi:hypothetical protein
VTVDGTVAEGCAVVCSVFCGILAYQIVRALDRRQEKRRRKRWWGKEWPLVGASRFIDTELKHRYPDDFKNLLRMTEIQFEYLLSRDKKRKVSLSRSLSICDDILPHERQHD